jgi:glycerol uptake facilitator protein
MTPFLAELIGTMLLLLMGGGVVANACLNKSKGLGAGWLAITTAWALGVFIGVVVAGPYSGAHLNPAVTIAFAVAGSFPWSDVVPYIVAQFIGAALGAFLVWVVYKDQFDATPDPATKLGVFCTAPAVRNTFRNFLTEVVGTFVLLIVVFYITDGQIRVPDDGGTVAVGLGSVGAIPVSFTVWVIGLSLGGPTGYAINPARDLMPRLVHALVPIKEKGSSDWGYAWIPVLGPIVGGVIAAGLFCILSM